MKGGGETGIGGWGDRESSRPGYQEIRGWGKKDEEMRR